MSLSDFSNSLSGKVYGQLVLDKYKSHSFSDVNQEMMSLTSDFTIQYGFNGIGPFIDKINQHTQGDKNFFKNDSSSVANLIFRYAKDHFTSIGVKLTDQELIKLFNIILFNFVYAAYGNPYILKHIKKSVNPSFLKKLFG
ncbi:MAG TPA: hypothetical protein PKI01_10030 [Bacteroidales bacterium]|nr:hypothetical protein [Bacteroidales bacterium]